MGRADLDDCTKRSEVWKHFRIEQNNKHRVVKCKVKMCPTILKYASSTTNMWRHMQNTHGMKTTSKKLTYGKQKLNSIELREDSIDATRLKEEEEDVSNHEQDWESTEIQEDEDPFADADFEVNESFKDSKSVVNVDDKFVLDARREIIGLQLETAKLARDRMAAARDKAEAESFMAQLKRNTEIAEYNRVLGKNVPLFPLPGAGSD